MSTIDEFDIQLRHISDPEIVMARPDAWSRITDSLASFEDKHAVHLSAPTGWPLCIDPQLERPAQTLQATSTKDQFPIGNPANHPLDWATHILLLEEVVRALDDRVEGYEVAARQRSAQSKPPSERLVQLLEEKKLIAQKLLAFAERRSRWRQFSTRAWLRRRAKLIRSRVLTDEWIMEKDQGFHQVLDLTFIEQANNLGSGSSRPGAGGKKLSSPMFPETSKEGARHAAILENAREIAAMLQDLPEVPLAVKRSGMPDYAAWANFRSIHPQRWSEMTQRILAVRAEFYAFWLDNRLQVDQAMRGYRKFAVPESWDEAMKMQHSTISWVDEQFAQLAMGVSAEDKAFIRERGAIARLAAETASMVRAELERAKVAARNEPYSSDAHETLFRAIDKAVDAGQMSNSWHINYQVIRSNAAKGLFSAGNLTAPRIVVDNLRDRWEQEAGPAVVQLGGKPRGNSYEYREDGEDAVMLFQIPSNHLTRLTLSDSRDIVVSITADDLRNGRFERAKGGIPSWDF
ncbi:hypothetical protein [Aurantiacibacter sp. MUD61]|uniref:hypothetical protein n=1 Tax=Aurantiacibacter sp. MUD61 TaxID=3009083 RepID=UPI0022F0E250|nr:hypothetical protein [Aurantiacibacter sp. MUD61]